MDDKSVATGSLDSLDIDIDYFWKKNIYTNFLLREIIKMLIKMQIMKILLLVTLAKVRIKVIKQSN